MMKARRERRCIQKNEKQNGRGGRLGDTYRPGAYALVGRWAFFVLSGRQYLQSILEPTGFLLFQRAVGPGVSVLNGGRSNGLGRAFGKGTYGQ
jgi:hypothetical protein